MARKSCLESDYYTRVVKGEVPCEFLYEDDQCVVFDEDDPQSPVHFLVIPKNLATNLKNFNDQDSNLFGHLLLIARNIAVQRGLHKTGFHMMLSEDFGPKKARPAAIHVFGRALHHMLWPVGPGSQL